MPIARICTNCGTLTPTTKRGRCPRCAPADRPTHTTDAASLDDRRQRAYSSSEYRRERLAAIARDGACLKCGSTEHLTTHHRIPVTRGGSNHRDNLATLCRSCHGRMEQPKAPAGIRGQGRRTRRRNARG